MSTEPLNFLPISASKTRTERIEPRASSLAGKMLSGKVSQYAIHDLIQSRPGVRTYTGVDLQTQAPVLIKEYYSFWWTISDIQQIELALEQLEALNLCCKDAQGLRVLIPQESIASLKDHRCYLVLQAPEHQPRSLRSYLESQGSFSAQAVHSLLLQVLQSLGFLHSLTFYLEDKDEVKKGIAHGNLNLDSILIEVDLAVQHTQPVQFQVYLQDLQLWEAAILHAERPQIYSTLRIQKQKDLQDLGKIATQLLLGELDPPHAWNPFAAPYWQDLPHDPLKHFIQQLIGAGTSTFSGAKAAHGWLLSIPAEVESPAVVLQTSTAPEAEPDVDVDAVEPSDAPPLYFKAAFAIVLSALILNIGFLGVRSEPFKAPALNRIGTTK